MLSIYLRHQVVSFTWLPSPYVFTVRGVNISFAKSDFPLSGLGVFEVVMLFFWRALDFFPIYDIISPRILVWFLLSYFSLRIQSSNIYSLYFLVFPVIKFIFTIKLCCFSPHTHTHKERRLIQALLLLLLVPSMPFVIFS